MVLNRRLRASCEQVVVQGERPGRSDRTVDPQLLKMALAPHPKLKAALFPAGPRGNSPSSDVSVYHLLQVRSHLPAAVLINMLKQMSSSCDHAALLWQNSACVHLLGKLNTLSTCCYFLQALAPLDPSRLFSWQTANTLNSTGELRTPAGEGKFTARLV